LGLLGFSTLEVMSLPTLVAVIGGVGLIGFGRLVGSVDQLVKESRTQRDAEGVRPDQKAATIPQLEDEHRASGERIEPRL
jgi:hypothetical protein